MTEEHQRQLEHVQKSSDANADRSRKRMDAEIVDLQSKISKLDAALTKVHIVAPLSGEPPVANFSQANKDHLQDLQTANVEYESNRKEQAAYLQRAEEKARDLEARSDLATQNATKHAASLAEKENEKHAVQGELDDLLMVFGDLEDKVKQYRGRLKKLGETVSDGEDEDDDGDDGEDEDDVD